MVSNDNENTFFTAYTKISEQIIKEDNIIHQRTTSGLSINGVLATLAALGYGVAKDNIREQKDLIIAGVVLCTLAFVAIWVCYSSIRGIRAARRQNAYIQYVYNLHWRTIVEEQLKLPRPFGGNLPYKDENGKKLKVGAGSSGTLFRAVIVVWVIALVVFASATINRFYQ
jgi:hypothetical protein